LIGNNAFFVVPSDFARLVAVRVYVVAPQGGVVRLNVTSVVTARGQVFEPGVPMEAEFDETGVMGLTVKELTPPFVPQRLVVGESLVVMFEEGGSGEASAEWTLFNVVMEYED
jgi:hypothetical protein